ncbi:putative metalloprotease CJM1_0395 family protein [Marinobacter manganoxydans]|uniref:SrpA-related protein n=1 Tax=Marinobacter manganoxydans MnI7-9 TaxID=1094979 RepID=G6YNW6_9GAMM|nr:putative metalloprotease CJM1_0395 family protein [Marinobacter manganoxydans]EHJ06028.1 hypothetical protein KYE_02640 [Marinobacter manganoxydans MnI7-9]
MLSSFPPVPPFPPGASFQGQASPRVQAPGSAAAEPEAPSAEARFTEASGKAESARENPKSKPDGKNSDNPQGLSEQELKARDREVRAHEAAHQAVGGQYAGAMSFTYQRGSDGAQYAVGGEVSIDLSPVQGDPQATIEKMRVVRAAAMAPAEPSGQDRAVAAQAMQIMLQAQSDLATESGSSSRAASDAYREVSAMGDVEQKSDEKRVSSFEPVSA